MPKRKLHAVCLLLSDGSLLWLGPGIDLGQTDCASAVEFPGSLRDLLTRHNRETTAWTATTAARESVIPPDDIQRTAKLLRILNPSVRRRTVVLRHSSGRPPAGPAAAAASYLHVISKAEGWRWA